MLEVGVDMSLLNLNGEDNDPGAISIAGALKAVRDFHVDKKAAASDPGLKLRLMGSSLGGYITSRCVCCACQRPSMQSPAALVTFQLTVRW